MSGSPPVLVREARPSELRHLSAIEDSGAPLFREWCTGDLPPALVAPAPTGHQRDAEPGRLLVALDPAYDGGPVGFAHLLWLRDDAIVGRVRSLRYRDMSWVQARRPGRLRRSAELRAETSDGRRVRFFELPYELADRLAAAVSAHAVRRLV